MDAKEWPAHSHRRCKLIRPARGYRQSLRSGGQRLPRQTCHCPGLRSGISDDSGILPRMRPAAFVAEKIDRATDPVAATRRREFPVTEDGGLPGPEGGLPVTEDRGSRVTED